MSKSIPAGFTAITPYLIVEGATQAIEFYRRVFGATVAMQLPLPDGGIAHCELDIAGARFMLADACPDEHFKGPRSTAGSPVSMMLYVDDVDAVFSDALANGAKEVRPVHDPFYGDRAGTLEDPFGHIWTVATHIEDLSEQELTQRMADFMNQQADA